MAGEAGYCVPDVLTVLVGQGEGRSYAESLLSQ